MNQKYKEVKESLKPLFTGISEVEIDQAVEDLKKVLDQAAEESKGELDISTPVKVSPVRAAKNKETRTVHSNAPKERPEAVETVETIYGVEPKAYVMGEFPLKKTDLEGGDILVAVDRRTASDPLREFAYGEWEKKATPIEKRIYAEYKVAKTIKSINRKKKWNGIFRKLKLSSINLSTNKEEKVLREATVAMFMHVNKLDELSLQRLNDLIRETTSKHRRESVSERVPVLYGNPI